MNNKLLSFAAAAASLLTIAACNKDDAQAPGVITADKTVAYAKVAISMPKGNGTRANGNYVVGTTEENAIDVIHLAFYDGNGTYVGNGKQISDRPGTEKADETNDNIEKNISQIFQIKLFEGANEPEYVIAFINTPLVQKNLDVLTRTNENNNASVVLDATALFENQDDKLTNFAMTNAGYYDGNNNYVVAAPVAKIFDTADEAAGADEKTTTAIYVERLVAKVTVKTAEQIAQNEVNYSIVDVEGNLVTLKFTPQSWSTTGTAKTENVVKTQFAYDKETESWKNNEDNFRSFWAQGVNYFKGFSAYYTPATDEKPAATTGLLKYVTYGDLNGVNDLTKALTKIEGSEYVPEHTTQLNITDDHAEYLIANTYAFVAGTYEVTVNNAVDQEKYKDEESGTDFFLLMTGYDEDTKKKTYTIYNTTELTDYLLNLNNLTDVYESSVSETNKKKGTEYFKVDYDKVVGKYTLVLIEGKNIENLKKADGTAVSLDALKTTNSRHYHYVGGAAYFNAKIVHNSFAADADEVLYGVVRNHSYILTINKIENLGAPIDNNGHDGEDGKNDPIIPDPDDLKDHFINASIDVLSWHQINNNVTL